MLKAALVSQPTKKLIMLNKEFTTRSSCPDDFIETIIYFRLLAHKFKLGDISSFLSIECAYELSREAIGL